MSADKPVYQTTIHAWESNRFLQRVEANGIEYVQCTDFRAFNLRLDMERKSAMVARDNAEAANVR